MAARSDQPDKDPPVDRSEKKTPYEIYKELDLGPGDYAIAPSTETRKAVREAILKKLGR